MSQTTIYLPLPFARTFQDPQNQSSAPTPAAGSPSTTGGASAADATGTASVPTTGATGAAGAGTNQPNNQQPVSPCGGEGMLWMMPMFLVLMYFMMIRPEQKRKKEQADLLAAIKVGDNVVMLSGMHGLVSNLDEKTVTLRTEDSSTIKFDRSAVARIVREEAAETGK